MVTAAFIADANMLLVRLDLLRFVIAVTVVVLIIVEVVGPESGQIGCQFLYALVQVLGRAVQGTAVPGKLARNVPEIFIEDHLMARS